MVSMYQDKNHLFIARSFVEPQKDGSVRESEKRILDFGIYDELRVYPEPQIAKLGNSSDDYKTYYYHSLSNFFKVS